MESLTSKQTCRRRDGHNRVCFHCGQPIESDPKNCPVPQHALSFDQEQACSKKDQPAHPEGLSKTNLQYRQANLEKIRVYMKDYHQEWYAKNRNKRFLQNHAWAGHQAERTRYHRPNAKEWHADNHGRARENTRRYYANNQAKKNGRRNEVAKLQRARDMGARMRFYWRSRLSTLIRQAGKKTFSFSRDVLLYSGEELCNYMEQLLTPEMTWDNYGKYWELDHIRPCEEFDLSEMEQARECFALMNLRPLQVGRSRRRFHKQRRRL